ncbi:MAG: precorrin-4 C(11)-methyltransferase [Anaerolineae bacterium]|nr:precorrin-4 C(11)-methyltransferase [Anaerolineales bacterium]MCQ3972318.1 precorrin-4 C(11)-methyltransferase [Anaerolineae bacterium]
MTKIRQEAVTANLLASSPPRFLASPGTVYFIGAGPGAPDLITVRGRDLIAQADLMLYADSLVEESVAGLARKPEAQIVGSSGLHLDQILTLMVETAQRGGVVARVHSGDPALYGATHEQMAHLEDHHIPYEVVPGVTAAFAAAARLKVELTIPDLVQTIILTRTAGRTTMPAREDLRSLAAAGASLAIYLSISRIRHVVDDLLASGGYQPETPVAVFHKVTWPDESYLLGTLADIAEKVRAAGYTKHALILVSPALEASLKGAERRTSSHLYDKSYTHRFRRAEDFKRDKERQEAESLPPGVVAGEKHLGSAPSRSGAMVIAVTRRGSQLAVRLAADFKVDLAVPDKFSQEIRDWRLMAGVEENLQSPISNLYSGSTLAEVQRCWPRYNHLILVMPTGVAVRAIAPLLGHKASDPAVVCLDEAGQSVIPLLGGHQAGANELARQIATLTGGYAAITTASEVQGKPALDLPPQLEGRRWQIDSASALTHASACLVNDEMVGIYLDPALASLRPQLTAWLGEIDNLTWVETLDELDVDAYAAGLIISHRVLADHYQHLQHKCVLYRPPVLVMGLGCKRDVPAAELGEALKTTLTETNLALESAAALATVDLKADEPGLQDLARQLDLPLRIVESARLGLLEPAQFSPSAAQAKFDLPGVAEPCALLVAGGELIVPKRSFARCTVAVALKG